MDIFIIREGRQSGPFSEEAVKAFLTEGSVRATLTFVYNDHSQQYGWGKESPDRLDFTWKAIAEAHELDAKWDYKQAIDTSLVEK